MARMREETLRGPKSMDEGQVEDTQERDLENPPEEDSLDSNDMSPLEKIMTLEAELIQAKAKADEHKDHMLRLQAEFDNYRKRTQKEKQRSLNMHLNALYQSYYRF